MQKPVLALFDFDGTITTKDTLPLFLIHSFGLARYYWGVFRLLPTLLKYQLDLVDKDIAKEKLLGYFLNNQKVDFIEQKAQSFAHQIDKITNPQAISKIKWHQSQNHQVVIVSASLETWIKPWADIHKITKVVATKMQTKTIQTQTIFTDKLDTPNCFGVEKVARIKEVFGDLSQYYIYSYGDSKGDQEMLSVANESFFKRF